MLGGCDSIMTPLLVLPFLLAQPQPPVVVTASGADPIAGRIAGLAVDGTLTLTEPNATVPAGSLVSIRRPGKSLPAWPKGPQLILANGDRFAATATGGNETALVVDAGEFGKAWSVPLTAIAAWWIVPPPTDTPPEPKSYAWAAADRDSVRLRNGDTLRGTVSGIEADGSALRLTTAPGQPAKSIALADVAAVAFDPRLARVRKPKGWHPRATFADGTRLTLASATADAKTFAGTTAFGAKFARPLADLIALDGLGGKAVYLADLKPKAQAVEGFNGTGWPPLADRSTKGNPLRLPAAGGVSWYDKGLGTHPKTVLTYSLGGKYRRFVAEVGMDPITGRRGTAAVRVLVDGKERAIPGLGTLSLANSPVALVLDVTGAKELTLEIDFGPTGDVQTDVNWCDARLIE